jgi:hypothetical protein
MADTPINDFQFFFITQAIANGSKVSFGSETVDGSQPFTFGQLRDYYYRIENPNLHSESLLMTAQVVARLAKPGVVEDIADAPLDKTKLKNFLSTMPDYIDRCRTEGREADIVMHPGETPAVTLDCTLPRQQTPQVPLHKT